MHAPGQPTRRDLLKAAPLVVGILGGRHATAAPAPSAVANRIEAFDYRGVVLRDSRWRRQILAAREFYLGIPDDNILHGFRKAAGMAAPGKPLGGWCKDDSSMVFGQWLSGMARLQCATGDKTVGDKATLLMNEWARTIKADGDCRMGHYQFDKLVCGLVDLKRYAGNADAEALLDKTSDFARRNLKHDDMVVEPAHNTKYYGLPQEWYTLSENLYRAYQLTGNEKYKDFAALWHYPQYWNKFANTAAAVGAQGVHAYSHVNSFSSAAMAYAVTGNPDYLRILRNAYDYLQKTQCYATGGYGPNERLMSPGGALGKALETRSDTFETVCGSWAGFKLSRYLMQFTGEARYGDWIERLFYNGVGAALPLRSGGRNFYYSDYRISGGMKVDYWENFTCCSATYIQNMADYHNLIYYRDAAGLYVNLYVPSEVTWAGPQGELRVVQETDYPVSGASTLTIETAAAAAVPIQFRVPGWSRGMTIRVNGADTGAKCTPGDWAVISRAWRKGDRIEVRIPIDFRMEAVDAQHPDRVAIVRGPVVFALDYNYHDPAFELPRTEAELNRWLVADESPAVFSVRRPDGRPVRLKFRPFFEFAEQFPYLMYFDRKRPAYGLW